MPVLVAALACLVVGIADGDTLTVRCEAQADQPAQTIIIRLAEIDAPEKRQPFGERNKQALASMCFQKPAAVKPQTRDRYGRTVARVNCDGTDANAEIVRSGMAWAVTKYLTDPQIKAIEMEARAARRGLWADREPVPPWEWRKAP
jgi:micrococcal nuclease